MKISPLFTLLTLLALCVKAQNPLLTPTNQDYLEHYGYVKCLTIENEKRLKHQYPNRADATHFENWITNKLTVLQQKRKEGTLTPETFNIPVVVHVIHNGDAVGTDENISDAQVFSQIRVLNDDYRRQGEKGSANTTGLAVDTNINFCLAKIDPNGNPTNGIDRQNLGLESINSFEQAESIKEQTYWDPTTYLNMWIFKFGKDPDNSNWEYTLGYAQFPNSSGLDGMPTDGGTANTDGVVARYNAFGSLDDDDGTFTLLSNYGYGRTMTHEVGHWLGLRHVWGDAETASEGCNVDDFCQDTPNSESPNFACEVNNSCPDSDTDMIQNYMDYTPDSCMDTFTQDQKDRMHIVLTNSPRRKELNSANVCNTLSVKTFSDKATFKLYPNPTTSVLNVIAKNNHIPSEYKIYDTTGRCIHSKVIASTSDLKINTTTFNNGIYFLTIKTPLATTTLKFVKK